MTEQEFKVFFARLLRKHGEKASLSELKPIIDYATWTAIRHNNSYEEAARTLDLVDRGTVVAWCAMASVLKRTFDQGGSTATFIDKLSQQMVAVMGWPMNLAWERATDLSRHLLLQGVDLSEMNPLVVNADSEEAMAMFSRDPSQTLQ